MNFKKPNEQVIFNQMSWSARNQIKYAFDRINDRWRILCRPLDVPVEYVPIIVCACFTLQNFFKLFNVEADHALVTKIISNENCMPVKLDQINSYTTSSGTKVWKTIAHYFKECSHLVT